MVAPPTTHRRSARSWPTQAFARMVLEAGDPRGRRLRHGSKAYKAAIEGAARCQARPCWTGSTSRDIDGLHGPTPPDLGAPRPQAPPRLKAVASRHAPSSRRSIDSLTPRCSTARFLFVHPLIVWTSARSPARRSGAAVTARRARRQHRTPRLAAWDALGELHQRASPTTRRRRPDSDRTGLADDLRTGQHRTRIELPSDISGDSLSSPGTTDWPQLGTKRVGGPATASGC